jgi:hypothetical protein
MTREKVDFCHLIAGYAEPKHGYVLEVDDDLNFNAELKFYNLKFRRPDAPRHVTRQVTVFEDQFLDTVARREPTETIRRDIDDALGNTLGLR